MPSHVLPRLLTVALILTCTATAVAAAFAIIAPLVGQPLITGFPVACVDAANSVCALEREAGAAQLVLDRGEIVLPASSLDATVLRVVDVAITGGFAIVLIWLLRRFVRDAASGRPFTAGSTHSLARAGVLLMACPVWQLLRSALWQMSVIAHQGEQVTLIHTLAPAPDHAALRLLPEFSPEAVIAGLILLVVSRAFGVGVEVQRDSDEVI